MGKTPRNGVRGGEATVGYKTPQDITETGVTTGVTKAKLSWDKALVGGFLAGAYIAFGGLVAIEVDGYFLEYDSARAGGFDLALEIVEARAGSRRQSSADRIRARIITGTKAKSFSISSKAI